MHTAAVEHFIRSVQREVCFYGSCNGIYACNGLTAQFPPDFVGFHPSLQALDRNRETGSHRLRSSPEHARPNWSCERKREGRLRWRGGAGRNSESGGVRNSGLLCQSVKEKPICPPLLLSHPGISPNGRSSTPGKRYRSSGGPKKHSIHAALIWK